MGKSIQVFVVLADPRTGDAVYFMHNMTFRCIEWSIDEIDSYKINGWRTILVFVKWIKYSNLKLTNKLLKS